MILWKFPRSRPGEFVGSIAFSVENQQSRKIKWQWDAGAGVRTYEGSDVENVPSPIHHFVYSVDSGRITKGINIFKVVGITSMSSRDQYLELLP
jgi:hypothetical protein